MEIKNQQIENEEINLKDKIERVSVLSLKYFSDNPRKHSNQQIEKIAKQIKKVGFNQPLIIDELNQVLVGNGRLEAADKLNMDKIPCIIYKNLTNKQKKQLIIADNKLNDLSFWDNDILGEWLNDLNEDNQESYFEPKEMTEIWEETNPKKATEDNFEEPKEPKYKIELGEIWQLGEHRLMCGDSTKKENVDKLMNGVKADMVLTDPPYNTGMSEKKNSGSTRLTHMFNDSFTDEEWDKFTTDFCNIYYDYLKNNSVAYICLDWRRNYELIPKIKKAGFHLSNIIVWDKVVHGLGSDYKYTYELINVCKKGKPELKTHVGEREYSDMWHIQRKIGRDKDHATKKPIELCNRPINHASKQNDTVLDLFGGSGSTLIACEQLNRSCYMMELDEYYCSVIIERWEKLTNKKATKL